MKAKKPDKCIKAQCGASCDFHTTDMLYGLGYDPQDCPYYRYNPNNENDKQNWKQLDNLMDEIYKNFIKQKELELFQKAEENKLIEDAVLIMHPKYKAIIAGSGLHKATILWSDCCEEDKVYMVTDEEMKAYMRDGSWNFKEREVEE